MYTQCPDCDIAFKVTAEVLKQAAGMVRCGSCGTAFNSLEYLSEQMPDQPVRKETDIEIPELKPESTRADTGLPKSISAEQSAALLKTLDELAGSHDVTWHWVRGHAGHAENERADLLANQGLEEALEDASG